MKVGMLARADDRGLGHQTWDWWRHMHPDRTMVVIEPGSAARGFTNHLDRYPDAMVVTLGATGQLDPEAVHDWLVGLDVVYTAETFYDPRFVEWARDLGVATVQHANPEFWHRDVPWPTQVWTATTWRLAHLPAAARVVPVPVPWLYPPRTMLSQPPTFLHLAGTRAVGDRNGTVAFMKALRDCTAEVTARIVTQTANLPAVRWPANVHVELVTASTLDREELYAGADVLVMPRRYGGLCLPVLEAAGAGLAIMTTDTVPNGDGPGWLFPCSRGRGVSTPAGDVSAVDPDVEAWTAALDRLARQPSTIDAAKALAHRWAREHSWEALRPELDAELARAVGLAR